MWVMVRVLIKDSGAHASMVAEDMSKEQGRHVTEEEAVDALIEKKPYVFDYLLSRNGGQMGP